MKKALLYLFVLIGIASCAEEDSTSPQSSNITNPVSTVPNTYTFERNGYSSVNYAGQSNRIQQLKEISGKLKLADQGQTISANELLAMYKNQWNPFLNTYSQQLYNKTFSLDTSYFVELFENAAQYSALNQTASNGVPGRLTRSNGAQILLDSNGREFTQLIEKGIMGAVFFHQVVNVYLNAGKIGPSVNNTIIDTSNNATEKEHHFDEAFGYMGFPINFSSDYSGSESLHFWAKYSATVDPYLKSNDKLMSYFIQGRKAIVDNNDVLLDQMVLAINEEFEKIIAATAIHYINESISATNTADALHTLSEAYAFVRALRYANAIHRKIPQTTVEDILQNKIGKNLYLISTSKLNEAKDLLSSIYSLDAVKNQL